MVVSIMKNKQKRKKIRKRIFLGILAVILCYSGYIYADKLSYPITKARAVHYLCSKYDADKSEIELVDYNKAGIFWDDENIFWQTPEWYDFSFDFRYNNRTVLVSRCDGKFCDDYQLPDIQKWCTQWLQENVDESIIGIELWNIDLYNYQAKRNNHRLNKNDTLVFLKNGYFMESITRYSFVYFSGNTKSEEVEKKAQKLLSTSDRIKAIYTSNEMEIVLEKGHEGVWNQLYTTKSDL